MPDPAKPEPNRQHFRAQTNAVLARHTHGLRFEHGTQSFIVPKVYRENACNWQIQLSPISFQHFFTILRSISDVRYYAPLVINIVAEQRRRIHCNR